MPTGRAEETDANHSTVVIGHDGVSERDALTRLKEGSQRIVREKRFELLILLPHIDFACSRVEQEHSFTHRMAIQLFSGSIHNCYDHQHPF